MKFIKNVVEYAVKHYNTAVRIFNIMKILRRNRSKK